MHRIINEEILAIIRSMLRNIEVENKENGIEYAEDIKNPEGTEVNIAKTHEELYKDLINFRELFNCTAENSDKIIYKNTEGIELGFYLPKKIDRLKR